MDTSVRVGGVYGRRLATIALVVPLLVALTAGTILVGASLLPSPSPIPADRGAFAPARLLYSGYRDHTATLLADGRVLVVGGQSAASEVWDPATGTSSPSASPWPQAQRAGTTSKPSSAKSASKENA